jgi:hypothetical protein
MISATWARGMSASRESPGLFYAPRYMRVESIESLVGAWIRRSIRWPDGREDKTTRVWWLQGLPDYGDVRIPAQRPSFDGVTSLAKRLAVIFVAIRCDEVRIASRALG